MGYQQNNTTAKTGDKFSLKELTSFNDGINYFIHETGTEFTIDEVILNQKDHRAAFLKYYPKLDKQFDNYILAVDFPVYRFGQLFIESKLVNLVDGPRKCSCDIMSLLSIGCVCGGI